MLPLKRIIGIFLLSALSLILLASITQSSVLAYSASIFTLVGVGYFSFHLTTLRLANQDIQPLMPVFPHTQFEFMGQVKVMSTPSGGRCKIHDKSFILPGGKYLRTLTSRSTSITYLAGLPCRYLHAGGPKQYILCESKGRFFLWRQR